MRHTLLALALLLLPSPALAADVRDQIPNQLTPHEIGEGWIQLFDGETLFGWKASSDADWKVADGVITVSSGKPGLLCTTSPFADYELRVDFRAPAETNSGIFLRTVAVPKDPAKDCYELNIATEKVSPFPSGSFVGRKKAEGVQESTEWRSYHVIAEGGHLVVMLDGARVLDYTDPTPIPRGLIGLQLNSGHVEFRNVKLKPLGLKSLFNGKDLTGWKEFPGKKSVFSVTPEGALNVMNGDGQLETEATFGDFVLQAEVFVNGKGLNSGFFFRSLPGQLWQGYESQIHNGYKDNDRTKPVDCGTGGFYRRQSARKVVAYDFKWFTQTLVVAGDHMATWVNGYQVSDWTDERKPNENPRQGRRLEPGTIIIQGHDKTTDLSFKNLQAGETPK